MGDTAAPPTVPSLVDSLGALSLRCLAEAHLAHVLTLDNGSAGDGGGNGADEVGENFVLVADTRSKF